MISTIPEYRNLIVKWISSHQDHTCVYMETVLFPFLCIVEQSKAPNSFSFVTHHHEDGEVLCFPTLTQSHACMSIYPQMEVLSLPKEPTYTR
jgi:hypothetical protein